MTQQPFDMNDGDEGAGMFAAPGATQDGVEGPGASGRKPPRIGKGNLLLFGLFAAGIGSVYLLSRGSAPSEASAEQRLAESQVDSVLSRLNGTGMGNKRTSAQAVVESFYRQAKQRQIPLGALRANPFVFVPPKPVQTSVKAKEPPPEELPAAKELAEAMENVKQLELQSVLKGKTDSAIISNNLLTEGQTIRGWTVSKIRAKEVVLKWNDHEYVLAMP